ncbi:hypothetical protein [Ornithinimicrobium tianjinense]|uniref:Uncharacterized protein n=1 Tax=Ornithinimicrobium tianjinense TaxID=1195761 RepID=A0A917BFY1_9MICO|nr:hypothetical protein [Ornithinimicrobium tianjinense]GGF42507.1 hypothetical protein GCM10011366_07900 [Ornithinimicrobium tianjinense]
MRRPLLLLALVWVPFLSIFLFASPVLTGAVGDSYPHVAFHVVSPAMLLGAAAVALRWRRARDGAALVRALLALLVLALAVAVLGNGVELLSALRRLAEDGWVSRLTPDLFEAGSGLHSLGASLTIPAHMGALALSLALVGVEALRARRGRDQGAAADRAAVARR